MIIEFIKLYIVSIISMFVLDMAWLAKIAPALYKATIGHLMAEKPNMLAAGAFYAIYIFGLVFFVVQPAYDKSSLSYAATRGALFGLVAYATFDLTGMAVLKDWPLKITIIDMLWGTVLTASAATLATFVATRYF